MRVDLSPTLPQLADHFLPVHRIPNCWPLRAQLGNGAVQGPALERYYVRVIGGASISQSFLVVLRLT